ncbi:hypothetical protein ACPTIS_13710 [Enterococcus faecalis]|uniref:hypothetical protein n=1 Tax=Enterococcus faecalis TaxID=1351 RepID=UPI003CC616C4
MKMNVIVEISDRLGMDYYFVSVRSTAKSLLFHCRIKYYKIWHQEIPYHQITEWHLTQEEDIQEISFAWQETFYRFVDYGTGIVPYLTLFCKVMR